MKIITKTLHNLSEDKHLRCDVKFHKFISESSWILFKNSKFQSIPLSDILIEKYSICNYKDEIEYKGIPTGYKYIDEDGEIISYQEITKWDHPDRLKYSIGPEDILISSLRLAKTPALNFEIANLKDYVFSNGFYIFQLKNNWNLKFVLYLLRNRKIKDILDKKIYRGIGISSYRANDLLKIKVRNVSLEEQNKVIDKIKIIEDKIRLEKTKLVRTQEVVDYILSKKFNINIQELNDIKEIKGFKTKAKNLLFNNINCRISCRWEKAIKIQKKLISLCDCIKKLDKYILEIKNGWSPECVDEESKYKILGIDSICESTQLSLDIVKHTKKEHLNIKSYMIKDNDFFVSRGNTTELVALASVAKINKETEILFSDLMMRVDFNKEIDKQYMAYIFNSFIGRLYFKYASKGKNQTMVKISKQELNDFYVPLPSLSKQIETVNEINEELKKQNNLKENINKLRENIDVLIEEVISQ